MKMTKEIAIRYCDEYLARHISDIDKEFLEIAKEALQQQPCDKCVYSTSEGCQYDDITETIPPVTPQLKTGHWIGDGNYICSCCKRDPLDFLEPCGLDGGSYMDIPMKYCPNCGAKMVEPQAESEK